MAGTKAGGQRAAATNKQRYGDGFYARIGAVGGRLGNTGGFKSTMCNCDYLPDEHKKAQCAGAKGGSISRRKKNPLKP